MTWYNQYMYVAMSWCTYKSKCIDLCSLSLIYEISHSYTSSLMFCFSNLLWSGLPVHVPWLFSCPKPWLDCSTWAELYPPGSAIQSSPWYHSLQAWYIPPVRLSKVSCRRPSCRLSCTNWDMFSLNTYSLTSFRSSISMRKKSVINLFEIYN